MDVKAIAFDLDDTLLRSDGSISPFTLKVLQRARQKGIHIIPASGRTAKSMRAAVEAVGCSSCFICCNGAEVRTNDHELLMQHMLPVPLAREIAAFARDHACYAQIYDEEHFYYSMHGPYADQYARSAALPGVYMSSFADAITQPTPKILMMDSVERIAHLLTIAQQKWSSVASVTCSKPYYLEITPPGATKGNALRWCGEYLGFDVSQAVAFGDSLNDISMLETAGLGVCMQNAREDVKALIPTQCLSNDDDGVARFILDHILKEEAL